jgi:hypothetical protein
MHCDESTFSFYFKGLARSDPASQLDEREEDEVGAIVVRNYDGNEPTRRKITVQQTKPITWSGDILLTRGNTAISVFPAPEGGSELSFNGTDNRFSNNSLPVNLYVEGTNYSDNMRDTDLIAEAVCMATCTDTVKFTVLWMDSFDRRFQDDEPQYWSIDPSDYVADDVASADNQARGFYDLTYTLPPALPHLGLNLFFSPSAFGYWVGWGYETEATLHPSDFLPPEADGQDFEDLPGYEPPAQMPFTLEQDVDARYFKGTTLVYSKTYGSTGTLDGNDGPVPEVMDATPSDAGRVFFLDAPGLPWQNVYNVDEGGILSIRANFRVWARYIDSQYSQDDRCSAIFEFYVKFDMERKDPSIEWRVLDNENKDSQNNAQCPLEP